jgi:WD40 repeat protein
MFTPEQETELGDLMAEQTENRYQVIQDPTLTAYMDRIASRLISLLPPTGLRIQIFLIDTPILDAFSAPGGRIYVSRKMVAFLRDEDEMAGLLGHEMGHIVTHQSANEMTRLFQNVLGVSQVGSRQDLANKYNQLLDNASRGTPTYRKIAREEEPDQYVADQVALYAVANAGYAPRTVVAFFDRLAQTHGKTGTFFSNWFGLTNPNEKRLGIMQKALAAMPPACVGTSTVAAPSEEFQEWQSEVIGYSNVHQRESLPGLLTKQSLNPPLRGDLTQVRFSPDGQYALAQDESSIFVLTRLPFVFLFRLDAPEAHPASFTPDSKDIVFSTAGLRVEGWNIASQKRTSVHELVVQEGCAESLLSPDGKTMACLVKRNGNSGSEFLSPTDFDLEILDVASGEAIFTRKRFIELSLNNPYFLIFMLLRELSKASIVSWAFSPDARYLVAASTDGVLAVDLVTKGPITLRGPLKDMLKGNFAFLSADRVVAENSENPVRSAILKFPSGELISSIAIGHQALDASAQGNYALLRPVKDALVGVMDAKTGKGVLALKQTSAIDLYNQIYMAQAATGEVGLFDLAGSKFAVKAELPVGPLGPLRTQVVSPDLRWLAVAGDSRGAVWDLSTMKRLYFSRGFRGAFFDGNAAVYVDFPKNETVGRTVVREDLATTEMKPVLPLDADSQATQYGPYLVSRKPNRKDKSPFENVTLEVGDIRDGKALWTLNFPKGIPRISVIPGENRIVLQWNAQTSSSREAAREELRKNKDLKKRFSALREDAGIYVLEVLEAGTGHFLGAVFVDTGKDSFKMEDWSASGDWLLVTDDENRILVYSVANGELKGSVFGERPIISPSGLMGIRNKRGQLQFYTLPALEKGSQLNFSSSISMDSFSADGTRLFVLTEDQNFYIFDTSALRQSDRPTAISPN